MDQRNSLIFVASLILGIGTALGLTWLQSESQNPSHQEQPGTVEVVSRVVRPASIIPNATAICLLTLDRIESRDERPACGALYDVLHFTIDKAIGDAPISFSFVRDHGAQISFEGEESTGNPYRELSCEMLTVGKQYYFLVHKNGSSIYHQD